ncbi:unnamed protein product [Vitrella brassicaformis CCMP3155]|uniref:Uncharacterized protein n=2 Tax=Vitrella brassicaformis TaxID=1169539 RepID=A0A0G4FKA1_VITBC|nr:unnamed protein product [Vitrella brassicaformis CCMP3155]|mmetsp:Transcript_19069/g.45988  ORF Transcript_19069/g.45988 Transcript_19069/m.45988 type:complete len:321 (+) Transcript_19069:199-1161(+)|eukprot:CEM14145.1 unnamed protein product [Vitrella brassicaformis CCMP3155]
MENDPFLTGAQPLPTPPSSQAGRKRRNRFPMGFKASTFGFKAVACLIVVPWLLYTIIALLFAFAYHDSPLAVWATSFFGLVAAIGIGLSGRVSPGRSHPSLNLVLSFMMVVAVLVGVWSGTINYNRYIAKYWAYQENQAYANVIATDSAAKYGDAGKIFFTSGTIVNTDQSVGFKQGTMFCVAPIQDTNSDPTQSTAMVQFWAVGTNCCGKTGGFRCGDAAKSGSARGGVTVRMTKSYKKAIHKAEAYWGLTSASEPVLVKWVKNPNTTQDEQYKNGMGFLVAGIFVFLFICVVLGGLAAMGLRATRDTNRHDGGGQYGV